MQKAQSDTGLTVPDLVILGFLMERPMHGYQLALILKERQVKDWAGVSKPQVYYSLKKLEASGLIHGENDEDSSLGPERRIFTISHQARAALAEALDSEKWAHSRPVPPFATWAMLSVHARPNIARRGLERRKAFLQAEIVRERQTLDQLSKENDGKSSRIAESLVSLAIRNFELELGWLDEFEGLLESRPS